jgi:polygalacturonase
MKRFIVFVAGLLAFAAAEAKDYTGCYANLASPMTQVSEPVIPANEVNIKDFGGVGDGLSLNTEAFKKAISALEKKGGGRLVVPQGVYLTGLISLKDNIDLHLERNAIIMATPDKTLHVKENNGVKEDKATPLINASKRTNICITGEGIIDGNGAQWRPVKRNKVSDVEWKEFTSMGGTISSDGSIWLPFGLKHYDNIAADGETQEKMRADLIRLTDCKNVKVEGVTIQNSPRFHLHPVRCENVIIDGVTVRCPWNAQNGDAIDLSNCRTVLLINSVVDAGDDGICMKGGTGASGVKAGPCEDILIQDNTVFHAHGGFVIGSDVSGGMKNIVVRRCTFSGTDVGLRFKSGIGRGGKTEGIRISDITMTDIKNEAIIFECTYIDKKYNYKEGSEQKNQKVEFAPDFQDIEITRVTSHNSKTAISAHGLEGLKCVSNIKISDSQFFYTKKDIDKDNFVDVNITGCKFETYKK